MPDEVEAEEYRGHRIEVRARLPEGARSADAEAEPELLIDDEPVSYGRLPDGSLYLYDYAYDWRDDLVDLARGYIDHQTQAEAVRRQRQPGEG